jgi:hypothetical protein
MLLIVFFAVSAMDVEREREGYACIFGDGELCNAIFCYDLMYCTALYIVCTMHRAECEARKGNTYVFT